MREGRCNLLDSSQTQGWLKRGHEFWALHRYVEAVDCFNRGLHFDPDCPELLFSLGDAYLRGLGVPQDHEKAVFWLHKAAETGHATAGYLLGACYEAGLGLERDYSQAVSCFQWAAKRSYGPAHYALGRMYARGQGVEQDYFHAFDLYQKAAQEYADVQYADRLRQAFPPSSRKSILYADDDRVIIDTLCIVLEQHGYHAAPAHTGMAALTLFQNEHFDLVITNLLMAKRQHGGADMGGWEIARQIREKSPTTPVIMINRWVRCGFALTRRFVELEIQPDVTKCDQIEVTA